MKNTFYPRYILKQKIFFILLIAGIVAAAWAQGSGRTEPNADRRQPRVPSAETVTVSGSMIVARGLPAVKSGEVTYLISGINRLVGFVDGLKEGAQVTIEGRAMTIQRDGNFKFLRPSKLTLNGKSYDLAMPWGNMGTMRNFNPGQMAPRWNPPVPPRNYQQPAPPQRRQAPQGRQAPNGRPRNFL